MPSTTTLFLLTKTLTTFPFLPLSLPVIIITLSFLREHSDILLKLNEHIEEIKEIFPVKSINLSKTKNQIITHKQAFSILKTLLTIAEVPYEYGRSSNNSKKKSERFLRLIRKNEMLLYYIEQMSKNGQTIENDETDTQKYHKIPYEDIVNGCKATVEFRRTYGSSFFIKRDNIWEIPHINLTTKNLELRGANSCIKFSIKQKNPENIFSLLI